MDPMHRHSATGTARRSLDAQVFTRSSTTLRVFADFLCAHGGYKLLKQSPLITTNVQSWEKNND